MVGFGGISTEPPLLLLVLKGFWTWGLSLSLNLGAHTMGAPIFILLPFGGTWHPFLQYDFTPPHQPMLLVFCTIWGRSTYDLGGLPPGVDISVAGCHKLTLMPSVPILSARLVVVVAPWQGHHVLHLSTPCKDCSPVVGVLVAARLDLYYTTTLWNNKLKGRDHIFNNCRTYPIPCQGLFWITLGITCILIVTLPQYNMGYNFPLVYPIATIGSVLPSGTYWKTPFCNDPYTLTISYAQ